MVCGSRRTRPAVGHERDRLMATSQLVAVLVALGGCVTDLRTRRVPNMLTLGAAAGALGFHLLVGGWAGLGWAAAGWLTGLALFLPFFALGGIGGGDVKLLAALGAWLGPGATVWLAIYAALAGGVLAVMVSLATGYAGTAFRNVWGLLTFWRVVGFRPHPGLTLESSGSPRLPYALPIAAGLVLTLWLR
jgi:prepilin peptidase CpaA